MREHAFAGSFYEQEKSSLLAHLKEVFLHSKGPGKVPKASRKGRIVGVVVPHAGYAFSGFAAAHAYFQLSGSKTRDFVLIGPNHFGLGGEVVLSDEDFKTPLGVARCKREHVSALAFPVDNIVHQREHSIEVQIPFLQFLFGDDFSITPVCVRELSFGDCESLAKKIHSLGDVCVISSSDFVHFGPAYGFLPFTENVKERILDLDEKAIGFIEKLDAKGFYDFSSGISICGRIPITVLIIFARLSGAKRARLLSHYSSGDIVGDYDNCVDYASLVVKE